MKFTLGVIETNMNDKFKYVLYNAVFCAILYVAIKFKVDPAQWLIVGYVWAEVAMLCVLCSESAIKFLKTYQKTNSKPIFVTNNSNLFFIFDIVFDIVVLVVFFSNAWYLTSVIYFVHLILINHLKLILKD
jgi:hypothetical protein